MRVIRNHVTDGRNPYSFRQKSWGVTCVGHIKASGSFHLSVSYRASYKGATKRTTCLKTFVSLS